MVVFKTINNSTSFNKNSHFFIFVQQIGKSIVRICLRPACIVHAIFYNDVGQCIVGVRHIGAESSGRLHIDAVTACIPFGFYVDIHHRSDRFGLLIKLFARVTRHLSSARCPHIRKAKLTHNRGFITIDAYFVVLMNGNSDKVVGVFLSQILHDGRCARAILAPHGGVIFEHHPACWHLGEHGYVECRGREGCFVGLTINMCDVTNKLLVAQLVEDWHLYQQRSVVADGDWFGQFHRFFFHNLTVHGGCVAVRGDGFAAVVNASERCLGTGCTLCNK